MTIQKVVIYLVALLYLGCYFWLDAMYELSIGQGVLLYLGFLILILMIPLVPAYFKQRKLNAIIAEHGMYSEEYAEEIKRLAKDSSPAGEVMYYTSLVAVYLGMGDLKRAEQAVMILPMNWAQDKKYKIAGDSDRKLLCKSLYFNNAMCCYYNMNNLEKMEMYCQTGGNYMWQYLQTGKREEMKAAFRETLAAYHFLREEYDKAQELLEQIDWEKYPKVEVPVKKLKARILMAKQQHEEAKRLLLEIQGKEEAQIYCMNTEKLLAECEENLQKIWLNAKLNSSDR